MSFRFEVGQELKVHKDLSNFKIYMRPKGTIYILSRKTRVDHKGIERNRYKIAYEFRTNFLKIGDGSRHSGKDFVWEEDLMRAVGQRKNNYY
jgi:hypothetical protein